MRWIQNDPTLLIARPPWAMRSRPPGAMPHPCPPHLPCSLEKQYKYGLSSTRSIRYFATVNNKNDRVKVGTGQMGGDIVWGRLGGGLWPCFYLSECPSPACVSIRAPALPSIDTQVRNVLRVDPLEPDEDVALAEAPRRLLSLLREPASSPPPVADQHQL